tara:strand:+ start:262 stop:483 length:222 start_codon:yes stop_codon:yes gene_type:complete
MSNTLPPEIEDFLKKLKKLFGSNPMVAAIAFGIQFLSLLIPTIYFYVNDPLINDFKTRKETEEKNNKLIDVNS